MPLDNGDKSKETGSQDPAKQPSRSSMDADHNRQVVHWKGAVKASLEQLSGVRGTRMSLQCLDQLCRSTLSSYEHRKPVK